MSLESGGNDCPLATHTDDQASAWAIRW